MTTYSELLSYLGNKTDRPYGNNTRVQRADPDILVKLHGTYIATFYPDGVIRLNTGGYRTHTTKERINSILPSPWRVYQEAGVWHLQDCTNWDNPGNDYIFQDGITIAPDGSVTGAGYNDKAANKKLLKSIKIYAREYTDELIAGKIPAPSGGDCWGCHFHSDNNDNPLGTDHLIQHLEEKYHVPSLLLKAAIPGKNICLITSDGIARAFSGEPLDGWQADIVRRDVEKALYKYLKTTLTSLAA